MLFGTKYHFDNFISLKNKETLYYCQICNVNKAFNCSRIKGKSIRETNILTTNFVKIPFDDIKQGIYIEDKQYFENEDRLVGFSKHIIRK